MRNIPKYIGKLTIDRNEVLERINYYEEIQTKLRNIINSYENASDAPKEIRRQIYENRILLNHYIKRIKELNKKIHQANLTWVDMY